MLFTKICPSINNIVRQLDHKHSDRPQFDVQKIVVKKIVIHSKL